MPTAPPAPSARGYVGYREAFQLLAVEHFLLSVSRSGVCVFPPVRLPPRSWEIRMSVCSQLACPLNCVACFSGRWVRAAVRLSGSLAKYRQQLSGYPAVRLPRRPGHLASRRRVGARHSVSPSGSLTLRLRKNRAVSLFLRRWKLRVVVPGGCLAIRVFDSSKPASSWAVGFPGSAPIRVPDALPPGGVPSSLPSGSPPVLSLLLAALVPSSWRPHSSLRRFSEAC